MKKLLLLAVLAIASQVQADHYRGQTCGEYVKCEGSVREGQTFKCPDCVCPQVNCPILPEVICEAKAVPVKTAICPERQVTCGRCHKVKASCGCKAGFMHNHTHNTVVVEERTMTAPKRVQGRTARSTKAASARTAAE